MARLLRFALLALVVRVSAAAQQDEEPVAAARRVAAKPDEIIIGDVRVQALSPTLLRVEPRGPAGFEDRTTFTVVNRSLFTGLAITRKGDSAAGTLLSTSAYSVLLRKNVSSSPSCGARTTAADVTEPVYTRRHPNGTRAAGRGQCCQLCDADETCVGWLWKGDYINEIDPAPGNDTNCWPLSSYARRISKNDCSSDKAPLEFGCSKRAGSCGSMPSFRVTSAADGRVLYDTETDLNPDKNLLHWPPPLTAMSYALIDSPRFFVPEWAVVPWQVSFPYVCPVPVLVK